MQNRSPALRSLFDLETPRLKANQDSCLQEEPPRRQDRVRPPVLARERRSTSLSVFPNNLISRRLGYEPRAMWAADDASELQSVQVTWR